MLDTPLSALLGCLADPSDDRRRGLNAEINRVVAYRGQHHDNALKAYFVNPRAQGAYLVAQRYVRRIAAFAEGRRLSVPVSYKQAARSLSGRLPRFMAALNRAAGYAVCDGECIHIQNREQPSVYESLAILATHTGNTSAHSFAAEVEYHAHFLTPIAGIKIPFSGKSVYDSAIRADMTVDGAAFGGLVPFYWQGSRAVKRQCALHREEACLEMSHL